MSSGAGSRAVAQPQFDIALTEPDIHGVLPCFSGASRVTAYSFIELA